MRLATKHKTSSCASCESKKHSPFIQKQIKPSIQPKLKLVHHNDKYEREADVMAERVMRKPMESEGSVMEKTEQEGVQLKCSSCEEGIQKKSSSTTTADHAPSGLESQINGSRGGGSPLSSSANRTMSRSFGHDFSNVRVHTGSGARDMNDQLNAKAFTYGSDVYFNKGEYNPSSSSGKELLAHELTHVVQQNDVASVGEKRAPTPFSIARKKRTNELHVAPGRVKMMAREDARDLLTVYLMKPGLDENDAAFEAIVETLNMRFTIGNASKRLDMLTAAFSLLDQDGATNVLQVLTKPKGASQQHARERFGKLDRHFRGPLLNILRQRSVMAIAGTEKANNKSLAKYQEGKATWVELHPTVFAYVPDPGKTLKDVAAYVSRNPDLLAGLVRLNNIPVDKALTAGQSVIVPAELISRAQAWGEMSKSIRDRIEVVRGEKSLFRRKSLSHGKRGRGMVGPFPAITRAMSPVLTTVINALIKLIKGAAYVVSFAGGMVHGFFAALWDTVSGIVKLVYDLYKNIIGRTLLKKIKEFLKGLKNLTREQLKDMLGEWAAKWDKKLNDRSPFIAGHAHGYLTGYVMAEVAMFLITGGMLKTAFWASKWGQALSRSKKVIDAVTKVKNAGGKVADVVDKVRKSRAGSVVKAAEIGIKAARYTAETLGKKLNLPGKTGKYIIKKALIHAKRLGPYFERIGKLTGRAKRWLFGCHSPCEWAANLVESVVRKLTNEQIEIASRSANGVKLMTDRWLGKVLKKNDKLPEGYYWRGEDIVRKPGKREAEFAPLKWDRNSGELTISVTGNRISNPTVMKRNHRNAVKKELSEGGLSGHKLEQAVAKEVGENSVHHLLPDNLIQDTPLGIAAQKAGYNLDRGSNLKGLKKTEDLTNLDAGNIGHWSSHPKYDNLVRKEFSRVQKRLERKYGSLDGILTNKKLQKELLREMEKIESKFRKLFDKKKVPIDPKTGRLVKIPKKREGVIS